MRIDGFQNIPAVLQSLNTDKTQKKSAGTDAGPSSSVSLSSFAETLQSLQRESAHSAQIRNARVEQLTQLAQRGSLPVDLEKIASSMVNMNAIDTKG